MSSQFEGLEARAVALLTADDYFEDLEIIEGSKSDIASRVQKRLGLSGGKSGDKKIGVAIVAMVVLGRSAQPKTEDKEVQPRLIVAVIEHPDLNKSGNSGLAIAEHILAALWLQNVADDTPGLRALRSFTVDDPAFERIFGEEQTRIYGVTNANVFHTNWLAEVVVE